jgi:hypothetical protein
MLAADIRYQSTVLATCRGLIWVDAGAVDRHSVVILAESVANQKLARFAKVEIVSNAGREVVERSRRLRSEQFRKLLGATKHIYLVRVGAAMNYAA